jgi:HSP20 family protein
VGVETKAPEAAPRALTRSTASNGLRCTASPAFAKLPDEPSIIAMRTGSGVACAQDANPINAHETNHRSSNFKSLENKNAAPNSAAWLLHGAATWTVAQELIMFVLSRPTHRVATPQFGRFIDRLLDESVERSASRTPALDVAETDAGYSLAFDVPGATREQLKVSVEGRRVSIETVDIAKPATTDEQAKETPRVLYSERNVARYARTVSLPAEVDQASSSAKFENGVLTLTLAKKVPTGALQIAIN